MGGARQVVEAPFKLLKFVYVDVPYMAGKKAYDSGLVLYGAASTKASNTLEVVNLKKNQVVSKVNDKVELDKKLEAFKKELDAKLELLQKFLLKNGAVIYTLGKGGLEKSLDYSLVTKDKVEEILITKYKFDKAFYELMNVEQILIARTFLMKLWQDTLYPKGKKTFETQIYPRGYPLWKYFDDKYQIVGLYNLSYTALEREYIQAKQRQELQKLKVENMRLRTSTPSTA